MICPDCREKSLTPYMGGQFGKYICKNCDYIGPVYLVEDKEQKQQESKNSK
jgi:hypothetical protein